LPVLRLRHGAAGALDELRGGLLRSANFIYTAGEICDQRQVGDARRRLPLGAVLNCPD
jgi:hypothetical protein